ncbi:MAG: HEAT repeat domain-containing protein [Scytonema sp. CRU_2_7]|nr:HEAT repeat domain-containing protein [Scytonema sp. CRU_2_7]
MGSSRNESYKTGMHSAVPALLRVFDNPIKPEYLDFVSKYSTEEQRNWYGIEELAKIGNEEAISRLLTDLEHTNAGIRIKVVNALRYLKSDCAVDALLRVLQQDENLKVRQKAAEGLEEIEGLDTSRVLPDLLELMPTQSGEQVFSVISVIPSIQKRCQFYNYKVYQQAELVEKGLEGKGAPSMKNIRIEGAEVVQIIESNHGNVSGKTIVKRDF